MSGLVSGDESKVGWLGEKEGLTTASPYVLLRLPIHEEKKGRKTLFAHQPTSSRSERRWLENDRSLEM